MIRRIRETTPDTPDAAAARVRRQQIADQVNAEREAIWPIVTNDNAAAVLAWQRQRLAELEAQSCPHCGEALPRVNDYIPPTCGRSECQEAAYYANRRARAGRGARVAQVGR